MTIFHCEPRSIGDWDSGAKNGDEIPAKMADQQAFLHNLCFNAHHD